MFRRWISHVLKTMPGLVAFPALRVPPSPGGARDTSAQWRPWWGKMWGNCDFWQVTLQYFLLIFLYVILEWCLDMFGVVSLILEWIGLWFSDLKSWKHWYYWRMSQSMANPVRQTSTQRFGCILGATSNRDILTGRKPDGIHGVLWCTTLRRT